MRCRVRVFPGRKLRPRWSAPERPSGRVCPRIPCPAPRSRKFWALLRKTACPLVCKKNSRIRISGPGGPQEARSGSTALPVLWCIRPALTAPGGATVRPGGPQRLRRPAGAGIRPALTAPRGATARPGGLQRLRRAVGCLGIYPVPTARRGGKKFPLFFPFTRFLTLWTRYHEIPRRR